MSVCPLKNVLSVPDEWTSRNSLLNVMSSWAENENTLSHGIWFCERGKAHFGLLYFHLKALPGEQVLTENVASVVSPSKMPLFIYFDGSNTWISFNFVIVCPFCKHLRYSKVFFLFSFILFLFNFTNQVYFRLYEIRFKFKTT